MVSGCERSSAPFFCAYVHDELLADRRLGRTRGARERALLTRGLVIRTTLDPKAQRAAEKAVHAVPARNRIAAASASVHPGSGAVEAMAVSRHYGSRHRRGQTRVNLATGGQSGFQAGSTFKMFTLAAALAKGVPLSLTFDSPHQVHLDGFRGCAGAALGSWAPKNAEEGEGGRFGLVRGTWLSVNTYFAQLEHKIGVCRPWRLAKQMGITEISTGKAPAQVPAFTLGSDDTSPLQVAGAYATLARAWPVLRAARRRLGLGRRRRDRPAGAAALPPGAAPPRRGPHHLDPAWRHRRPRPGAHRSVRVDRPPGRRQDRDDGLVRRCLVQSASPRTSRPRFGSVTRAGVRATR